eukprot:scaffold41375_cov33-Tisochrysis_lutea.AAC.4
MACHRVSYSCCLHTCRVAVTTNANHSGQQSACRVSQLAEAYAEVIASLEAVACAGQERPAQQDS